MTAQTFDKWEIWDGQPPQRAWLQIKHHAFKTSKEAEDFIQQGRGGWVQHAHALGVLDPGRVLSEAGWVREPDKKKRGEGPLLAAERLIKKDIKQLQSRSVRYMDGEAWGGWDYTLTCGDKGEGTEVRVFSASYCSAVAEEMRGKPSRKMSYEECWRLVKQDGLPVWRPWLAIFAGWAEGSGQEDKK